MKTLKATTSTCMTSNTVKLSDKHLAVINTALEIYYRLKSGQINIALDEAFNYSIDREDVEVIEALIRKTTHKNLPRSAAYGFNSPEIGAARIAYEIKKTFEEVLAVKQNDGYYGSTVNFHGPLKASEEPLPEVLDFKPYKDFVLSNRESKKINSFHSAKKYSEMWEYIDSLKINLPKGEKTEIIPSFENVTIRVWKPRKRENI